MKDTGAFLINASGRSKPRKEEGALHHARRGRNDEAFLDQLWYGEVYNYVV